MPDRSDLAYSYDGSFEGLMSCVFEAFAQHESPAMLLTPASEQLCLLPMKSIETDGEKSDRVLTGLARKVGVEILEYVETTQLCTAPEIDLHTLRFLKLAFHHGPSVLDMLAEPSVNKLFQAMRHLHGEAHLLTGFIRFSESSGALTATIEPKNHVLPLLLSHFESRFNAETFMIYDKTHGEALVHQGNQTGIFKISSLKLPELSNQERYIQALWSGFYQAIGIKERENPRCRMTHMPKRYWSNMIEMQQECANKSKLEGANPEQICYNQEVLSAPVRG